jgi:hypothetical protein
METTLNLSLDFQDMIDCLNDEGVAYIVVGGFAMAVHGYIRATGDLDIFIKPDRENAERVYRALGRFGAPLNGIRAEDFANPGTVYQMGLPPFRIDIITKIDGVEFDDAYREALRTGDAGRGFSVLSLRHIIANKNATGREKDSIDAKELKALLDGKSNG